MTGYVLNDNANDVFFYNRKKIKTNQGISRFRTSRSVGQKGNFQVYIAA